MLDFWYSERCTREIKLIASILTCAIIYYCSSFDKLSPTFTIIALVIGIATHLFRQVYTKLPQFTPMSKFVKVLNTLFPILALAILIYCLPKQNLIYTAIQTIGFSALGLFIVSIYQNRAKRYQ